MTHNSQWFLVKLDFFLLFVRIFCLFAQNFSDQGSNVNVKRRNFSTNYRWIWETGKKTKNCNFGQFIFVPSGKEMDVFG